MSGYIEKVRAEIIQSILKGWDKIVTEQEEGRRPVNRAFTYREQERREGKWRKKNPAYGQHSALSYVCDSGVPILYHEFKSIPWVLSIP